MGKLFRTPEGFLDLTGQRVGGRYPQDIADAVAPTLDLFPLVGSRLIASETAPSLTSAIGDTVQIEVPENEVWLLFEAAWTTTPTLNSTRPAIEVRLTELPGSSSPSNQIVIVISPESTGTGQGTGRTTGQAVNFPTPICLPPGAIIEGYVRDTNHATTPWAIQVGFYRLTGN